jgi:lysine/ornithine N-monooxygenase
MDLSELTLEINIIEFMNKWKSLSKNNKQEFISYLKYEFYAIDDEYSLIFDFIFYCLDNSSNLENDLSNSKIPCEKLNECIRACINYYNDYDQ